MLPLATHFFLNNQKILLKTLTTLWLFCGVCAWKEVLSLNSLLSCIDLLRGWWCKGLEEWPRKQWVTKRRGTWRLVLWWKEQQWRKAWEEKAVLVIRMHGFLAPCCCCGGCGPWCDCLSTDLKAWHACSYLDATGTTLI